jgi:hypothetical protein
MHLCVSEPEPGRRPPVDTGPKGAVDRPAGEAQLREPLTAGRCAAVEAAGVGTVRPADRPADRYRQASGGDRTPTATAAAVRIHGGQQQQHINRGESRPGA